MTMKVFNLGCEHDHAFEGWFASTAAYDSQLQRGLIECPMCGTNEVRRLPSAPRLNLSRSGDGDAGARADARASGGEAAPGGESGSAADTGSAGDRVQPTVAQLQTMWLTMARHIREHTEDVGDRFAEEARRIHYNEAPARGIRGVASGEQKSELADEGIEVFSFPMPKSGNGPLQ